MVRTLLSLGLFCLQFVHIKENLFNKVLYILWWACLRSVSFWRRAAFIRRSSLCGGWNRGCGERKSREATHSSLIWAQLKVSDLTRKFEIGDLFHFREYRAKRVASPLVFFMAWKMRICAADRVVPIRCLQPCYSARLHHFLIIGKPICKFMTWTWHEFISGLSFLVNLFALVCLSIKKCSFLWYP